MDLKNAYDFYNQNMTKLYEMKKTHSNELVTDYIDKLKIFWKNIFIKYIHEIAAPTIINSYNDIIKNAEYIFKAYVDNHTYQNIGQAQYYFFKDIPLPDNAIEFFPELPLEFSFSVIKTIDNHLMLHVQNTDNEIFSCDIGTMDINKEYISISKKELIQSIESKMNLNTSFYLQFFENLNFKYDSMPFENQTYKKLNWMEDNIEYFNSLNIQMNEFLQNPTAITKENTNLEEEKESSEIELD